MIIKKLEFRIVFQIFIFSNDIFSSACVVLYNRDRLTFVSTIVFESFQIHHFSQEFCKTTKNKWFILIDCGNLSGFISEKIRYFRLKTELNFVLLFSLVLPMMSNYYKRKNLHCLIHTQIGSNQFLEFQKIRKVLKNSFKLLIDQSDSSV